jgi:hypothetical protein
VELTVNPGYVVAEANAVNLIVTIGSGACLKGAEVHFIRNPQVTATPMPVGTPALGLSQDGNLS